MPFIGTLLVPFLFVLIEFVGCPCMYALTAISV